MGSAGSSSNAILGVTVHAGLGVQRGLLPAGETVAQMNSKAKRRWQKAEVIIIDEISMIRSSLFQILSDVGPRMRSNYTEPFGGVRVIAASDSLLPPVSDYMENGATVQQNIPMYGTSQYCFQSAAWQALNMVSYDLTFNHRSGNCCVLPLQLERIRKGKTGGKLYCKGSQVGLLYRDSVALHVVLFFRA